MRSAVWGVKPHSVVSRYSPLSFWGQKMVGFFWKFVPIYKSTLHPTPEVRKVKVLRNFKYTIRIWCFPSRNVLTINTTRQSITQLTYLLTPWSRVLLEKLTVLQLVKKFPAFHGTWRFITALTSVHHLSLSWASPIQSIYPHPTSCRSILILSTHLRLGLPSNLFPSGFPTKTLYAPLSSPIRATSPDHLILLDFITRTILGEEYRSFSS